MSRLRTILDLEGAALHLPDRSAPDAEAMAWHRERVYA
jgi:hypothetical protein